MKNLGEQKELASIIIVTHNHRKYIDSCLNSVLTQDYPHEIIVVDNFSTDNTPEYVEKNFPNVKLIRNKKNVGYGAGNNIGAKYARGDYLVFLNPDTIVEKGWLRELVKPLEKNKKLITTPKILTYDGSMINTCGIICHFTGLSFTRGFRESPSKYNESEYVSGFSGCCFAIRRSDFEELGKFDENFFIYNEDTDLSWRAHLKGFKIMYIPSSIVKHDYSLKVDPWKIYHLEKARYIILRKYLSKRCYLLLLPSILMTEILTWGYAVFCGVKGIKSKIKSLKEGITIKIEKTRYDPKRLLKDMDWKIPVEQLSYGDFDKVIKRIANIIYEINYKKVIYDIES